MEFSRVIVEARTSYDNGTSSDVFNKNWAHKLYSNITEGIDIDPELKWEMTHYVRRLKLDSHTAYVNLAGRFVVIYLPSEISESMIRTLERRIKTSATSAGLPATIWNTETKPVKIIEEEILEDDPILEFLLKQRPA